MGGGVFSWLYQLPPFSQKEFNFLRYLGRQGLISIFWLLLVASILFSIYSFYQRIPSGTWSVSAVLAGSDYLKEISQPEDEVFTAAVIFPYLAHRPAVLNISHPTMYKRPDFLEYHRPLPPSPEEIQTYLEKNRVKYVINDLFTYRCYFRQFPELDEYVQSNYHLVKVIPNSISQDIEIYQRD